MDGFEDLGDLECVWDLVTRAALLRRGARSLEEMAGEIESLIKRRATQMHAEANGLRDEARRRANSAGIEKGDSLVGDAMNSFARLGIPPRISRK